MYTLVHDRHSQEEPQRDVPRLRRTHGLGPAAGDLYSHTRNEGSDRGTGRAPQSESFRGGGIGRQGTFKKATLSPCAVATARYVYLMANNTGAAAARITHTSHAAAMADLKTRKAAAGTAGWDAGEGYVAEGWYCPRVKRVVTRLWNPDGSRCA